MNNHLDNLNKEAISLKQQIHNLQQNSQQSISLSQDINQKMNGIGVFPTQITKNINRMALPPSHWEENVIKFFFVL